MERKYRDIDINKDVRMVGDELEEAQNEIKRLRCLYEQQD